MQQGSEQNWAPFNETEWVSVLSFSRICFDTKTLIWWGIWTALETHGAKVNPKLGWEVVKCNSWKDQNLCEKTGLVPSFYPVYSFHPDFWFRPQFFLDTLPLTLNVSLKKKDFHWVVRVFLYMVFWVEYSLLLHHEFWELCIQHQKKTKSWGPEKAII